jgi:hypothetical protein
MRISNQVPLGAPPSSKSYHRRLIELAVVGIVLGAVFLLFWQGVLRFSFGPATWDAQYCQRLLGQYDPAIQTGALSEERTADSFRLTGVFGGGASIVEIAGIDNTVATCSINIVSDQPVGSGYGEPYNCTLASVRYKSETQNEWLMTAIQTELSADIAAEGARFATLITYYNPAVRATYNTVVEKLNAHACEIS